MFKNVEFIICSFAETSYSKKYKILNHIEQEKEKRKEIHYLSFYESWSSSSHSSYLLPMKILTAKVTWIKQQVWVRPFSRFHPGEKNNCYLVYFKTKYRRIGEKNWMIFHWNVKLQYKLKSLEYSYHFKYI